jgi:hypothetical protein
MDLATRVKDLAERIATVSKAQKLNIGTLSNLTTTEKTSLVLAINEIK